MVCQSHKPGGLGQSFDTFASGQRKSGGWRKEGADALMRLADALCGFVRAALAGQAEMKRLLESGERKGYVKEL